MRRIASYNTSALMKSLIEKVIGCANVLLLILISFSAAAQTLPSRSRSDTSVFKLNDKTIHIIRYQYGDPHIRFLSLHDTEKTGLKAAFKFMGIHGGFVTELQYGKVRHIDFSDSLRQFSFDPNNMFTYEGAYIGLAKHSLPRIHEGLPEKIQALGNKVLEFGSLDSLGAIVTLHNNYNGGFSIFSYTQGNYLEGTADDVYINSAMDPDDLIFVTDRRFFDYLKNKQVNVVLQSIQAPDDGSLSVYAMLNNIPYANVEVQHGHLDENYRLILIVNDMIKEIVPSYQLSNKQ